jgi:hypothetical protein
MGPNRLELQAYLIVCSNVYLLIVLEVYEFVVEPRILLWGFEREI